MLWTSTQSIKNSRGEENMRMRTVIYVCAIALPAVVNAQSMTDQVDFSSDSYTKAEMSRADIESAIAKLKNGETLDLSGKALNGLDLSRTDLRRVNLQAARLMHTNLSNANLEGVNLDSVWSLAST